MLLKLNTCYQIILSFSLCQIAIAAEPPTEAPGATEGLENNLNDRQCEVVQRYALAIALLRENGIQLSELPRKTKNLGFDTASVDSAIYNNPSDKMYDAVHFIKWNCDHLGFNNLSLSLKY